MITIESMKWNVAVLSISWRADRHEESHCIEFELPTEDNPSPEHPVIKGRILSVARLPMSSEWGPLFASVKVKKIDHDSLTVQYGKTTYTVHADSWVKLGEGGMSYTSFELFLSVHYALPKPKLLTVSHDEEFLRRFRLKERILRLTDVDVQLLRKLAAEGDPFAQYGLARWLYYKVPTDDAMREAEELLTAAQEHVPDALSAYASMWQYGETKENVMDLEKSRELMKEALRRGSERAAQQMTRNRLFGLHQEADPFDSLAAEIEQRLKENKDSDPHWHTLLACAYEFMERDDDAAELYEEAIRLGDVENYSDLAAIYEKRGNIALYDSLMEEGIRKGSNHCCLHHSDMEEGDYQQLAGKQRRELHNQLHTNLWRGLNRGSDACAFMLWVLTYYELLGFRRTESEWPSLLKQGALQGNASCIAQIAKMAEEGTWVEKLTEGEIEELWLRVARYDPSHSDALSRLQKCSDPAFLLRHKEELEKYWQTADASPAYEEEPEPKTLAAPKVFTIQPTGRLDLIDADVEKMTSFREMAQTLINGDGLDAVHYSPLLKQITEEARLDQNLVMYVDRDGYFKDLPDNPIGTMLYGQGQEVRGTVILCLEDDRYESHSFTTSEDILGVYKVLLQHFGTLLVVDDEEDDEDVYDEDDGRWDAHV